MTDTESCIMLGLTFIVGTVFGAALVFVLMKGRPYAERRR